MATPPSFGGVLAVICSAPGFMPSRVFLVPPGTRLPAGVHAVVPVPPTGAVVALPEAAAGRRGRLVAARSADVFVTPPAATGVSAFGDVSSAAVPAGASGVGMFLAPAGTRLPPGVYTVVAAAAGRTGRTSSRGRGAVLPVAAASGGGPPADAGDADADAEYYDLVEDQAKTVLNSLNQLQPLPAHLATGYCTAENILNRALNERKDKLEAALLIFRGCYSLMDLAYQKYPAIQRKLPDEEDFLAFFLSSSHATPPKAMMGLLNLVENAPLPPSSLITDDYAILAQSMELATMVAESYFKMVRYLHFLDGGIEG